MGAMTSRGLTGNSRTVRDEIPRVIGGRGWLGGDKVEGTAWRPAIDISERRDAYRVTVEIPGIKAGEVEITMANGLLTIHGERHAAALPAGLRLLLRPDQSGAALLDGGWWPRSADPGAELPGLILALDEWHGRITRVMVGTAGWDSTRPHRVRVDGPAGSRVVRLGWFATMPAGLLIAISASGERTDLVTIPPHTSQQDARAAMAQAAEAGNRDHAPAILAAIRAADTPVVGAATGRAPVPAAGRRSS